MAQLTVEADRADLETKFLVAISEVGHSHIKDGERAGQRSVKFQHSPLLPWARLQRATHNHTVRETRRSPRGHTTNVHACVTHLTSVVQCTDVMRVLVRQLLPVAAPEAQCALVAVGGGVQPRGGVEAVVGEGLLGRGAQQLQEGQLDNVYRNALGPRVGELKEEHNTPTHQCDVKYK